jgi:hypothetical protein
VTESRAGAETDFTAGQYVVELAGLSKGQFSSWARAEIRDAQHAFLSNTSIYVYFFFDGRDKVIRHLVRAQVWQL